MSDYREGNYFSNVFTCPWDSAASTKPLLSGEDGRSWAELRLSDYLAVGSPGQWTIGPPPAFGVAAVYPTQQALGM